MNAPAIAQRLALCESPADDTHVMYQKWKDLLFAHWEIDPAEIQRTLPQGLTVDTYKGKAYLGVVPFFMCDIRPRFFPIVSGISNFLELNLRTYVYDSAGRPGVWFYSLDANQWLAVRVARAAFNLPYFDAKMSAVKEAGITYTARRRGCSQRYESSFYYEQGEALVVSPDSLEFFLIERYLLFATNRNRQLFSGRVSHSPYPLYSVKARIEKTGVFELAGFQKPALAPDHVVMSPGVDVKIFATKKIYPASSRKVP